MKKLFLFWILCVEVFAAGTNSQIISVSPPLSLTNGLMSMPQANGSTNGYLSSSDWTKFNNGGGGSGTVTSVGVQTDSTSSSIFANSSNNITGSPITTSGNMTLSFSTQTKNTVLVGPTTGANAAPTFRALVGADLPNPSASTLGGVESYASVSNQWINSISTSGVPTSTQPACGNLSNSAASCSTDTTNAGNISSGLLALARGGTHTDLSATGGTSQVLKQTSSGGNITVAQLACADLSNSAASCSTDATNAGNISSGTLPAGRLPALTSDVTSSAGSTATTVSKIQGTTVSGTTGSTNVVFSASPTLTGTAVLASATLSGSLKKSNCHMEPSETDIGNTGSSQSIDLSTANVWTGTLNVNSTFTFSNAQAGCPYVFILTQGTGGQTLTTAGITVIWGSGGTKTLSTGSGAIDKISCLYNGNLSELMCDLVTQYQ